MKPLLLLLIFLMSLSSLSQTTLYGDGKYVTFKLRHKANNNKSDSGIYWNKENLISEFILEGDTPLKYAIKLENDSIAALLAFNNGKWIEEDKIVHDSWPLRRIDGKKIISEFKITDFNKDGNEDLLCWVMSNMNGNVWTIVYLNDPIQQKLVKLWDIADDTDIWDRPEYETTTGSIHTTLEGSAYSHSAEATYKLEGLIAKPLEKHYQDRSSAINFRDDYYKGNNGKWELTESIITGSQIIEFRMPEGKAEGTINWEKENLISEFVLKGEKPLTCNIRLINDWQAVLSEKNAENYIVKDTLTWFEWPGDETLTQSFMITDFDEDGNEDLTCWHLTNVNGNRWMTIYLNNAEKGTLELLKNPIADEEDVWAAPEYDHDTKIITCTTVSGAFGISDLSTYRLDGKTAIALEKKEEDYSDVSMDSGHIGIIRTYVGAGDHWKLLTETKLLPQDED